MDLRPFCLSLSFFFALIGEGEGGSWRFVLGFNKTNTDNRVAEICFEKRVPQADGLGLWFEIGGCGSGGERADEFLFCRNIITGRQPNKVEKVK